MEIEYKRGMFIVVENTIWRVVGTKGIITADRPLVGVDDYIVEQFEKTEIRPYFLQPDDKIFFRGGLSTVMHSISLTDSNEAMINLITSGGGVKTLPTSMVTTSGPLTIKNDKN